MITVALLTFNRPHYLRFAIESILNQTYKDFDFWIIDNGSNSETLEVIKSYNDERICLIRIDKNTRESANIPFTGETREYFMLMHDDDTLELNFLEEMLDKVIRGNYDALGCQLNILNDIKENNCSNKNKIKNIENFGKNPILEFLNNQQPPCPTVIFRKSFIQKNSICFNLDAGPAADINLWLDIVRKGGLIGVADARLYNYRLHNEQDSFINSVIMECKLFLFWLNNNQLNSNDINLLNGRLFQYYFNAKLRLQLNLAKEINNVFKKLNSDKFCSTYHIKFMFWFLFNIDSISEIFRRIKCVLGFRFKSKEAKISNSA